MSRLCDNPQLNFSDTADRVVDRGLEFRNAAGVAAKNMAPKRAGRVKFAVICSAWEQAPRRRCSCGAASVFPRPYNALTQRSFSAAIGPGTAVALVCCFACGLTRALVELKGWQR